MVLTLKDDASPALRAASDAAAKLAARDKDLARLERALSGMAAQAKSSEARVSQLSAQLARLNARGTSAGKGIGAAADRSKLLAERAGDADTVVLGLAGSFGLVSPEAERAAIVFGDVAAGAEAVLRSGSAVARVLGPVALAVAAVGGAYAMLKKRLDEANAAQKAANEEATRAVGIHRKVKDAALQAALATGEITQAEYNRQVSAQTAADLYREQALAQAKAVAVQEKAVATAQKALDVSTKQVIAFQQEDKAGRSALSIRRSLIQGRAEHVAAVERETEKLDRLRAQLETTQTAQATYAENLQTVADAAGAAAAGVAGTAGEIEGLSAAVEGAATDPALERLQGLIVSFSGLAPPLQRSDLAVLIEAAEVFEEIERTAAELAERGIETDITPEALEKMRTRIETRIANLVADAQVEVEVDADTTAAEVEIHRLVAWAESIGITIGEGGVTVAAGATGFATSAGADPMGATTAALSATGPWGQLVAAILGALDMLGKKTEDGQSQIVASVLEADAALVAGIEALPEFLEEGLPEIIETTMTRVPSAIITALPEILRASIMLAMRELPAAIAGALPAIVDYVLAALRAWWADVQEEGFIGSMAQEGETDAETVARIGRFILTGGVADVIEEVHADRDARNRERSARERSARGARGARSALSVLAMPYADPGVAALRRFEVGEVTRRAAGRPFGGGGDVHVSASFVDRDAVDRIAERLQRNQGTFGTGAPRAVFNTGAG